MNGAEVVCAALKAAGVETVFGVPGTQTILFYEALRQSGIETVSASHELAATFMAQGYFRASGRLAAVSVIPGPGFAFALAALAEARLDSAALVLLTGQPASCPLGRRRSQAIDQATIAGPLVKTVINVATAAEAGDAIQEACATALAGEPGPVLVQLAATVWPGSPDEPVRATRPGILADPVNADEVRIDRLGAAVSFVLSAERVLFYAGQGAASTADELARLVETIGAVVATTPSGRGVLPEDGDRVLPLDAIGDIGGFNSVVSQCDVVVVLGAALAENGTVGFELALPTDRLVRVDASDPVLSTLPIARFSVLSSCGDFIAALLSAVSESDSRRAAKGFTAAEARALRDRLVDRRTGGPSDARIAGGEARDFFAALRRGLPADGCLVLDSGMHQLLARRHFVVTRPRGLLFPTDFQSMAFGLPAAIGAKIAQPDRAVVALIGDGGFAMIGLELLTAVRLGITLPVIVFADGALGLIRLDQLLSHGHAHATELGRVDYELMAAALGCAYARAGTGDIEQQVRSALRSKGPTLIVVPIGDAPALRRARRKRFVGQALKSILGPGIVGALRRLRSSCRP